MSAIHKMPIPSRKRALELGAAFIEADLNDMRSRARNRSEGSGVPDDEWDGREFPLTTSLEGDLMKVAEWASAAATLRALAAQEGS